MEEEKTDCWSIKGEGPYSVHWHQMIDLSFHFFYPNFLEAEENQSNFYLVDFVLTLQTDKNSVTS